ncbi:hypothetical protein NEIMUCOT_05982 [Neisseria mucosa ATCC 25996]|uniref:Uncharacterized protein n=1 Tax=Neisseria mucosa (strain ATCC 25996 / DSM 4631 / NCTC 10774 / M26) TaxID=546266 RepID=D2ZZA7_NEIM2|nr:hypothetical protein NEIMUCOT_05982 [Neisseria mucosa ATCC 25996]
MGVGRGAFQTTSLGKVYAAFSIVIPSPPTRGQAVAGMTAIREAVFYRSFRIFPCGLPPSTTG